MMGKDANYVPGWDCHGLPIEWKVEEENYRAKGKSKPDLSDSDAMIAFRAECRAYAEHWLERAARGVQAARRRWATGTTPYTTMSFDAEATIAAELMKFAMNGLLYRGSKPVMWSVVERTALAEAEVEYARDRKPGDLREVSREVPDRRRQQRSCWLTGDLKRRQRSSSGPRRPGPSPATVRSATPSDIAYGLYEVTDAPDDNWAKKGEQARCWPTSLADKRHELLRALTAFERRRRRAMPARHPCCVASASRGSGYDFDVPLLAGEHVTEDTGTGFVHTAPGHGAEDFEIWEANRGSSMARGHRHDDPVHG